ncbi:MAG: ABC transporter substrate-binding protein, partial [Elusimicrobia bacterium]|nr:ABC transporter substrate-binding protein [Elusimicrobiota bacterium]
MIQPLLLAALLAHAEAVRNPGTFFFAAIGEVVSLDPVQPYDAMSQGLIFNVYDTLLAFEGETNDKIVPRIATKVPTVANGLVSKDGRTYTFPIRKGVKFHDGRALTPEDVRYSILRFMLTDPAGGPAWLLLEPILGLQSTRDDKGQHVARFEDAEQAVRVEGDNVVIRLKDPFGPFLSILARWSYVMSQEWAIANGEWDGKAESWKRYNDPPREKSYFFGHMNGTGPFELERWDRPGKKVVLKRAAGYWGKPAQLTRVVAATVPEFSTRKLMLQVGDADLIEVPRSFVPQLENLPGVRVADRLPRLQADPALFFTFAINPVANPDIGSGKLDGD